MAYVFSFFLKSLVSLPGIIQGDCSGCSLECSLMGTPKSLVSLWSARGVFILSMPGLPCLKIPGCGGWVWRFGAPGMPDFLALRKVMPWEEKC